MVTTGEMSLVAPAFLKETATFTVSPAEMGLAMGERVTTTTGWGTLSRARAGMAILSVMVPCVKEMLLL